MKKLNYLLISMLGFSVFTSANAAEDTDRANNACPSTFQAQVDQEFGVNTSPITTCITKREHIRTVLNLGTSVLNPKSGISQTLNNAFNMIADYRDVYGINIGDNLKINIVAHFQGGQFLLNDEAYNRLKSTPTAPYTAGNPSKKAVNDLLTAGVHFYMCQNTMHGNGWKTADLISGVEEVPAGIVSLADYAQRGWAVITP